MKLVSYLQDGTAGFGMLDDAGITPLARRTGASSLSELIARDPTLSDFNATPDPTLAPDQVTLLPVLPDAQRIFCIGTNYRDHVAEANTAGVARKQTGFPMVFLRLNDTLTATDADLLLPSVSDALDFEGELAVVIGRGGRYIPRDRALEHVAGYGCFNDASVRDWQFHAAQVTPGKNFPATGAFGPWLVPATEVPDPQALHLTTRVNGEVLQSGPTADMIFDVAFLISYLSFFQELRPGDVIASGTPSGVGFARDPKLYLGEGDVCEVEISNIGTLRNSVRRDTLAPPPGIAIPQLAGE